MRYLSCRSSEVRSCILGNGLIYIHFSKKLMGSLGKMVHTYIYSSKNIGLYIAEKDLFAKKASIGGNHFPLLFDEEKSHGFRTQFQYLSYEKSYTLKWWLEEEFPFNYVDSWCPFSVFEGCISSQYTDLSIRNPMVRYYNPFTDCNRL